MTVQTFLIALTVGAGMIALWINFRFPKLAPESIRRAVVHVGAALLVGQIGLPVLHSFIADVNPMVRALLTIFVLGLPTLVYGMLSSIWVIRIAQGAFRR